MAFVAEIKKRSKRAKYCNVGVASHIEPELQRVLETEAGIRERLRSGLVAGADRGRAVARARYPDVKHGLEIVVERRDPVVRDRQVHRDAQA